MDWRGDETAGVDNEMEDGLSRLSGAGKAAADRVHRKGGGVDSEHVVVGGSARRKRWDEWFEMDMVYGCGGEFSPEIAGRLQRDELDVDFDVDASGNCGSPAEGEDRGLCSPKRPMPWSLDPQYKLAWSQSKSIAKSDSTRFEEEAFIRESDVVLGLG